MKNGAGINRCTNGYSTNWSWKYEEFNFWPSNDPKSLPNDDIFKIKKFFKNSKRPLVLFGAGVGLSGSHNKIIEWIKRYAIYRSWSAFSFFDHTNKNYFSFVGVYGNRGANFILQNCDSLLVLEVDWTQELEHQILLILHS